MVGLFVVVRVSGLAGAAQIQLEVWPASRVMVPLPADVTAGSFVAVMAFDVMGGKGAFSFIFHMANGGELQHAVQLYTDGTTEAALFDGPSGIRSLYRPINRVPALAGRTLLAIAVDGPSMRIYVNGVQAGTATDGTLSQGGMGFK